MFRKNQSGRSMVEMLGVLAIVGLLSLMALGGYRMAMDRRQANDLIHTEQILAIEIISGLVIGMDHPITSYHSPYVYSVDLFGGEAFAIQFPDIDESVCRVVLNKVGNKMVLAVNETLYAGNNDICTDKNVIQFRHNTNADTPETTCKPACGAEELCVEGTCCPKAHACGTQCCGADNNGVHLLCQDGRCVCPGDMTLNEGVCACVPSADTHCAESVFVSGVCICQTCEAGYVLNAVNQCEANACPENASEDGTGDETDVSGCRCNADTPTWTGTECVGATCATRMLDALVAAGMGDRETLKNNFDTLSGNSVHYQGYMEFKQDMDLPECALTIDGYFYAEDATVNLSSLTTITTTKAIALNLLRATLNVSGDIIAESTNHMAVRTSGNGTTISAHNLTATSGTNMAVRNEAWCNLNVSGALTVRSLGGAGIYNEGDITAGSIDVDAQNTGFESKYGFITVDGDVRVKSKQARGLVFDQGVTLSVGGTVTGLTEVMANGLNISGPATATGFYYCPQGWIKGQQAQCAPGCSFGACVCAGVSLPNCATLVFESDTCVCQTCETGYELTADKTCQSMTCPENASVDGAGDETDVSGCRCNADTPTWTGTECVGATCATRMLDALVAAGMGDWETLKNNFESLSGNAVSYTGNMSFKQDLDLSECGLTIDGLFYAEGNTVRLNRLTAHTTQNGIIGINLKDANLYVSGDIAGTSATNYGVRLVGSTIEAANLSGVSTQSSGIRNESGSVIKVGTLTAQNTAGRAAGLNNEGTIQATTISASSAAFYGMTNNGTITADGTVTGISAGDVNGVNNNNTITAATIYYCPSYWGRTFSSVPVCAPGCARGTCQ